MQALVVLDFLLQRGSQQSVEMTEEELAYKLADLESFAYTTPEGKDQGVNIRHRSPPPLTHTHISPPPLRLDWI